MHSAFYNPSIYLVELFIVFLHPFQIVHPNLQAEPFHLLVWVFFLMFSFPSVEMTLFTDWRQSEKKLTFVFSTMLRWNPGSWWGRSCMCRSRPCVFIVIVLPLQWGGWRWRPRWWPHPPCYAVLRLGRATFSGYLIGFTRAQQPPEECDNQCGGHEPWVAKQFSWWAQAAGVTCAGNI